jgi:hypothetical protein
VSGPCLPVARLQARLPRRVCSRPTSPAARRRERPGGNPVFQYLAARASLSLRGLVTVEATGGGRGNAPIVAVAFAQTGPWVEGEINAPLFEAALSDSPTRASVRLMLGALAALAGEDLVVAGLATDELRAAAGMADSTYRRARAALLASGEVALDAAGGGRSRTNRWLLSDPRVANPQPAVARRVRTAPTRRARPLIATVPARNTSTVREPAPMASR